MGDHCGPLVVPDTEYHRLASEGLLFERAYTPSAVCCPSCAFLSAPSVKRDLDPGVVLHSQRLKQAGYRLGYVGRWHCSYLRTPADFGFDDLANVFGCSP